MPAPVLEMIIALWLAIAVSLLLSAYAALSVLLAQLAGYRVMRRPLPEALDLRRSAAARKGWETRKAKAAKPDVFEDELNRVLSQIDAQESAKQ